MQPFCSCSSVHTPHTLWVCRLLLLVLMGVMVLLLCCAVHAQVLIEAGQRLPDGRLRQRCLPLSEKMIGAEGWQAAAVRAVSEELATALPQEWQCQVGPASDPACWNLSASQHVIFLRTPCDPSVHYICTNKHVLVH